MKTTPIIKLNKNLIYLCLMGSALIAVPLIVVPMARANSVKEEGIAHNPAQAYVSNPDDVFVLSGTERFPKNYGGVKDFDRESIQAEPAPEDKNIAQAFDKLAKLDSKADENRDHNNRIQYRQSENPSREARQTERKRQAFEHYDALRSDILFVDNTKHANNQPNSHSNTDSLLNAVERSLDLAENQQSQSPQSQNDIFFKRGPVGKIKEPLPHMVSEGTLIPAILLSEIDTTLPGPILARVTHNIWDSKTGQALLIPQNSQLIGEYDSSIGHGQTRAQIIWKRIMFPNQQSVNLGSMVGVDKRGTSGSAGSVDNHYDKVAMGLILTTALGGSVRMSQGKYDPESASLGQEYGNTLAQETARLGNKITDKMLSIQPTIKVPMGQRLNVFVEQDLSLQPYEG